MHALKPNMSPDSLNNHRNMYNMYLSESVYLMLTLLCNTTGAYHNLHNELWQNVAVSFNKS